MNIDLDALVEWLNDYDRPFFECTFPCTDPTCYYNLTNAEQDAKRKEAIKAQIVEAFSG